MTDVHARSDVGPGTLTRRDALKRSAVVGGAVLWTTPAMQLLSVRAADAASYPEPEEPEEPQGELPSHGLFVVRYDGQLYGYQVGDAGQIWTLGAGSDRPYLDQVLGGGTYIYEDTAGSTDWSTLIGAFTGYVGEYHDGTTVLPAIVVEITGSGITVAAAHVFDGSFKHDPDGDKFRDAVQDRNTLYFTL